ncbi:hypothetical protein RUM43_001916 [Polyplax serrata]|uniref:Uncharacterized protein n=1 Tax=Polyplax serrata TaxID=468196 RepID=A0AAN8SGX1_POLSC
MCDLLDNPGGMPIPSTSRKSSNAESLGLTLVLRFCVEIFTQRRTGQAGLNGNGHFPAYITQGLHDDSESEKTSSSPTRRKLPKTPV